MSSNKEYLIEFAPYRGAVKVSAIDPLTGTEVSIVGAPQASQQELGRLAVRKLKYVLNKSIEQSDEGPSGKKGGIVV